MKKVRFRCFGSIATLQKIRDDRLRAFLTPFGDHFAARDIDLAAAELDFERISDVFAKPSSGAPDGLYAAAYDIETLANGDGRSDLLVVLKDATSAGDEDVPLISAEDSDADVAVAAWLWRPHAVRDRAIILSARQSRRYRLFTTSGQARPLEPLSESTVVGIRTDLDRLHRADGGQGILRVIVDHTERESVFVVAHGQRLHRQKVVEGGQDDGSTPKSRSIAFHPEEYDTLILDRKGSTLAARANVAAHLEVYGRIIGTHAYGRIDYFDVRDVFTLNPLRTEGEQSLRCEGGGIRRAKLTDLTVEFGQGRRPSVTHRATDLFRHFARWRSGFPSSGRLAAATFDLKFEGDRASHRLSLMPPTDWRVAQDSDVPSVLAWLTERGFMRAPQPKPSGVWDVLQRPDWPRMALRDWERVLGTDFGRTRDCLRQLEDIAFDIACPLERKQGCRQRIIDNAGAHVGVCGDSPQRCGAGFLEREDVALHELDLIELGRSIRVSWQLNGPVELLNGHARSASLGGYELVPGVRYPAYLVAESPDDVAGAVASLLGRMAGKRGALVMMPDQDHLGHELTTACAQANVVIVDLKQHCIARGGFHVTVDAVERVLAELRTRGYRDGDSSATVVTRRAVRRGKDGANNGVEVVRISTKDSEALHSLDSGFDLAIDADSGVVTAFRGPRAGQPTKLSPPAVAAAMYDLAEAQGFVNFDDIDVPGQDRKSQITLFRAGFNALSNLTGEDWLETHGRKETKAFRWAPPAGWSFIIVRES